MGHAELSIRQTPSLATRARCPSYRVRWSGNASCSPLVVPAVTGLGDLRLNARVDAARMRSPEAVQMYGPTGPPQIGIAAIIDAIHNLETAMIALEQAG